MSGLGKYVYLGEYSYMILSFCIALSFIAAFGVVAGFLIRLFRSGRNKAKIVMITVGILVLLTPVLFIAYVFAGFPLHSMPVNKIVREYVTATYSGFDITVNRTWYDWYDGKYVTNIHDKDDKNISFEVWYGENWQTNEMEITDRYFYGEYWEKKIRKILTPLLEETYGDELKYVSMEHELFGFYVTVDGVKIGQQFDKNAPVRIEGNFSVAVKDTKPSTLAAEFVKYRDFIEKNEFTFESYLFRFRGVDGLTVCIRSEYINDDLATLIGYMQSNLDEQGSYYDGHRGLHYY